MVLRTSGRGEFESSRETNQLLEPYILGDLEAAIERCLAMTHEQREGKPDMVEALLPRAARERAGRRCGMKTQT
jgi:hypothetical protein